MRKKIILLFLLVGSVLFGQEAFRYDTIQVSKDDSRNIHRYKKRSITQQSRYQEERQPSAAVSNTVFNPKNLRYGLNLGFSLSNNYSLFRFAPQLGYQFNRYVMAGAGVSYYYSKRKYYYDRDQANHYSNSIGANAFAYLYPAPFIALSARPEINYIWKSSKNREGTFNKRNATVPSFVVGAGLRMGNAHAMLYYDLVQDVDSPYSSGLFYGVSVYF